MQLPAIIQGGMGVGISGWRLARAVASTGQMGVVSGTALDTLLVRRLQEGDPGGDIRRALEQFPDRDLVGRILDKYFVRDGKPAGAPYRTLRLLNVTPARESEDLLVLGNFTEVFLAKEGQVKGPVGINYLEKIQMATLPSLYGAILAGVDYVLMGAGIPREIPGAIDRLIMHQSASLRLNVAGAQATDNFSLSFQPGLSRLGECRRPKFLAIVSSVALASTLARKASGKVDGFVVEGPTAGGHNAPPRGALRLTESGEPIYGPRDEVDLEEIRALGLPFWLAGGQASSEALRSAQARGAAGIQVGTAFALCDESGLDASLRGRILNAIRVGDLKVFTDPRASPTGFPFKVVRLEGTGSEDRVYQARRRRCDLGYLRQVYKRPDGSLGYRCPGEPVDEFIAKGGSVEETVGRKCLCNGLVANIGLGDGEAPIVTLGDQANDVVRFMRSGTLHYRACDVVTSLVGPSVF